MKVRVLTTVPLGNSLHLPTSVIYSHVVDFKLPMWCHWMQSWEEMWRVSSCEPVWVSSSMPLLVCEMKNSLIDPNIIAESLISQNPGKFDSSLCKCVPFWDWCRLQCKCFKDRRTYQRTGFVRKGWKKLPRKRPRDPETAVVCWPQCDHQVPNPTTIWVCF